MAQKRSLALKFTASFLAALLIYESLSLPLTQAALLPTFPLSQPSTTSSLAFHIPSSIGDVAEVQFPRGKGRFVYHLQDVHDSVAAQTNLAEMISRLERFSAQQGKSLVVAVEGSTGKIDSDSISALPDKKAKEGVAAGLLRAGFLLGEEYAAILTQPGQIRIVGIEEPRLYRQNVLAREQTKDSRNHILQALYKLHQQLDTLREHNFNSALTQLEKKRISLEKGEESLVSYLQYIEEINPQLSHSYPFVNRMLRVAAKEKGIDFEKLEQETRALVSETVQSKSENEISKLIAKAHLLKEEGNNSSSYYSDLLRHTQKSYPTIKAYVAYLQESEQVNPDALFEEIQSLEIEAAKSLVRHPLAGELYSHLRWMERQERFFALTLTPQEWNYLKSETSQNFLENLNSIHNFVTEQSGDLGYRFERPALKSTDVANALQGARGFYTAAEDRNLELTQNLSRVLESHPADKFVVAFIAGGFHTPSVTKILRSQNVGYEILRPQLETEISLNQQYTFPIYRRADTTLPAPPVPAQFLRPTGGLAVPGGPQMVGKLVLEGRPTVTTYPSLPDTQPTTWLERLHESLHQFLFSREPHEIISFAILAIFAVALLVVVEVAEGIGSLAGGRQPASSLPLTPVQKKMTASNALLAKMSKDGILDETKLAAAQDYATAWMVSDEENPKNNRDANLVIVPDSQADQVVVDTLPSRFVVLVPEKYVKKGTPESLVPTFSPSQKWKDLPSGTTLNGAPLTDQVFLKIRLTLRDQVKANEKGITPRQYHDQKLDEDYLFRLNQLINDHDLQTRFYFWNSDLVRQELLNAGYNTSQSEPVPGLPQATNPASMLPFLMDYWFKLSHDKSTSPAERERATNDMKTVIEFMSSAPEDLARAVDQKAVTAPALPNEGDLMGDVNFKGQAGVDDIDADTLGPIASDQSYQVLPEFTSQEVRAAVEAGGKERARVIHAGLAHRYFAGGMARRLDQPDVPAALITPRMAVEWERKNGNPDAAMPAFPDLPMLDRFVLQVLSSVISNAMREGWSVPEGLANQRFDITLNDDSAAKVIEHLRKMNFFGLSPHQFVFVEQRTGPGFGFRLEGERGVFYVAEDLRSSVEVGTYGHGEPEFKHNMPNEYFTVGRSGSDRFYRTFPLHMAMAAEGKIYSHHQISLLEGLRPGWPHDPQRMSVGLGAIRLGMDGTAEFRKDNGIGIKGGMTGYGPLTSVNVLRFFKKMVQEVEEKILFTIEQSQVNSIWGKTLKKVLQGYTRNASVVFVNARALLGVIKSTNFPLIATVRGPKADGKTVNGTVHPDTWSYWYFNMLQMLFFIPRFPSDEVKEVKHFPRFSEAARRQDNEATNPIFFHLAKSLTESAEQTPQPISHQVFLGAGLLLVLGGMASIYFGSTHSTLSAVAAIVGLIGLAVGLTARQFVTAEVPADAPRTLEVAASDEAFNSRLVGIVQRFVNSAQASAAKKFRVVLKPGVWMESNAASGELAIGTAFLAKLGIIGTLVQILLLHVGLSHELAHFSRFQVSNPQNSLMRWFVNEIIAWALTPMLVLMSFSMYSAAPVANANESFVGRVVAAQAVGLVQGTRSLWEGIHSIVRKYTPTTPTPELRYIGVDIAAAPSPRDFEKALDAAVTMSHQSPSSLVSPQVVVFNSALAPTDEDHYRAIVARAATNLGGNLSFVPSAKLEGWNGTDIAAVFAAAGIQGEVSPEHTVVLSVAGKSFTGAQQTEIIPNAPYLSLALFSYMRFPNGSAALKELVQLFNSIFNVQLQRSLAVQIQADIWSAIAA